ncbi:hypothetical protein DICPUDRAFT_96538 [Dictyostelium purpureum]|uniref:RhoGEF domain-containing protein n=1 Tax=Dictyostelium purpureum TaxID=5786 RepID=F0Z964_DICPU|nr:uncharacterized protein DICPUDRAFT_96538 [Dictyostelium purpureum]EGC39499.1 hypothetical protein DICPUDRAFT_96538 [Dictyostelium purpureum]|eukprot:XP_003283946.1 hypothetical protein DICPUDRAFT_96538 [Dictyostelium purpureum]
MSYYSRALLKSSKSNFTLVQNLERVTDERIVQYIKTKLLVKRWIEEVIEAPLSADDNEELEVSLKNGIALCTLLNIIQPNIVPKIFTKFDFGFKNNIDFFIMGLNELGFPRQKQFSLKELYDGENFVRVVECLSELSKYVCSKGFHIPMKPITTVSDKEIKVPNEDEITLLRIQLSQIKAFSEGDSMKTSINKINSYYTNNSYVAPVSNSNNTSNNSNSNNNNNSAIGVSSPTVHNSNNNVNGNTTSKAKTTLTPTQKPKPTVSPSQIKQHEKGFILFQALFRGYKTRQFVKKMKRDIAYREKVQQEILKTEEDYIKNLNLCITHYMIPLYEKELINKEQQKMIFSNIEIIYNFGKTLLEDIRDRCGAKWTAYQKLSDLFLKISAFLKVYSSYVQNYDISIEVLKELRKSEKFKDALEEIGDFPEINNFELDSFLILPVQRIPRYYLLLQDLVKHTWPEHPDQKPLAEAAEKIRNVANFLNERKRQMENIQKFSEIQANLVGKGIPELITPSRQYIKQINYNVQETKSDMVVFICNDCMIIGKPVKSLFSDSKKKNIQYKGIIDYNNEIELKDDEKNTNYLNLVQPGDDKQLKLTIVLKNENEKNALKKELQQLINTLLENKNSIKLKLNQSTSTTTTGAGAGTGSTGNNSPSLNNSINGSPSILLNSNSSPIGSPRIDEYNINLTLTGNITPNGTIKPKLQRKKRIDNLLEHPEPENNSADSDQSSPQQPSSPTNSSTNNTRHRSKSTISKIAGHLTLRRKKKEKHLSLDDPSSLINGSDTGGSDIDDSKKVNHNNSNNNDNDSNATSPLSSPLSLSVPTTPPLDPSSNNRLSCSGSSIASNVNDLDLNDHDNNNNCNNSNSMNNNSMNNNSSGNLAERLSSTTFISYKDILQSRRQLDQKYLETYLSPEEFKTLFEIEKEEFYKLPKWKQNQKKVLLKLY